ncbi:hypothetical protein JAAARDRAFT_590942 [Jaapia argillacea MUCL 33604]|uniref:Uncharacterized protein n=1 Tax=Jaapia argillacea MUCL 33604 TaxID=933084 RepID=A0A067PGK1_9AGAM|nr:hypothetical protein JAAARDRAFT_590942 [Jaapia argillacea MUCL 33604]
MAGQLQLRDVSPSFPSLYNPALEFTHIQHKGPMQVGGVYLYKSTDIYRFTLYWTLILTTPPFVFCGIYAFLNLSFPPRSPTTSPTLSRDEDQPRRRWKCWGRRRKGGTRHGEHRYPLLEVKVGGNGRERMGRPTTTTSLSPSNNLNQGQETRRRSTLSPEPGIERRRTLSPVSRIERRRTLSPNPTRSPGLGLQPIRTRSPNPNGFSVPNSPISPTSTIPRPSSSYPHHDPSSYPYPDPHSSYPDPYSSSPYPPPTPRPRKNVRRSRFTFALLVLLSFCFVSVWSAVLGSAVVGWVLVGVWKAGGFSMSTWIPFIWAFIHTLFGLLSVWPHVVDII